LKLITKLFFFINLDPIRQDFVPPEASSIDIQQIPLNNDQSFGGQTVPNQQLSSTLNSQSSTGLKNGQIQSMNLFYRLINQIFFIYLDFPQQNQVLGSQQWLSKLFRQSLFKVILSI